MSIKLGDVIKLDDMAIVMKDFYNVLKVAHAAFFAASSQIARIKQEMFDAIREQHPELSEFEFSVSQADFYAVIIKRLPGNQSD